MINYILPIFILFILFCGIYEKKNIYELFISGVISGVKLIYNIFPYIFAIVVISGLLRDVGFFNMFSFGEVIPLLLMKPISGGASNAIVIDIFKNVGVDSTLGKISSLLMASTETTLYVISLMQAKTKIKNMNIVIICGLIGDMTAAILAVIFSKFI